MDLAAPRIDAGHDVLDHAVLACGVHALKQDEHGPAALGIEFLLQRGESLRAIGDPVLRGLLFDVEPAGFGGIDIRQREAMVFDAKALCEIHGRGTSWKSRDWQDQAGHHAGILAPDMKAVGMKSGMAGYSLAIVRSVLRIAAGELLVDQIPLPAGITTSARRPPSGRRR